MLNELFKYLYFFADYISVVLVYVAFFGAKNRISLRRVAFYSIIVVFAEFILSYFISDTFMAINMGLTAITNIFYYSESRKRWLAVFFPIYNIVSVLQTISMMVFAVLLNVDGVDSDYYRFVVCLPVVIFLLLMHLFGRPMFDAQNYSWKQYLILYLGSISMFFIMGMIQSYAYHETYLMENPDKIDFVVSMALIIICFLLCALSLYVAFLEKYVRDSKAKVHEQEFLMQAQKEQIETIERSEKAMHAFKHDLIAHLNALSALVDEGDMDKVKEYCDMLLGSTCSFKKVSYTGNAAIDGVLWRYKDMAEERGVDLDIKMVVPREKKISDYDLCILISNILKNAIEANEHGGHVEIATWPFNDSLCILQSNTSDYPLEYRRGHLVSRKRNLKSRGFGMLNIQAVIEKYDGSFDIKNEDELIKVEIVV